MELTKVFNELRVRGEMVEGCETARIFPIYKSGDENEARNYRLWLLDLGYKIPTNVMASRLKSWIEGNGLIKKRQAGFRTDRGTRDHIFVLNRLISNKLKWRGGKLYRAFVDFKAALYMVDRTPLIEKLEAICIKGRMLKMIKTIYVDTRNEIITGKVFQKKGKGITEKFRIWRGLRQGCRLSPILFLLVLEDVDAEWMRKKKGAQS